MIKKLLFVTSAVIIYMILFCTAFAVETENVISFAEVIVKPRHDATLDMEYSIKLNVSENATEPVSFVLMRIPNNKVDKIKAKSSNIKNIRYSYVNYGEFIRVDFKKSYGRGEKVDFAFSLHQSFIYSLNDDKCLYNFTPCEFKDINIETEKVYWKSSDVLENNGSAQDKNFILWSLEPEDNGVIKTVVVYDQSHFKLASESSKEFATERGYSIEHIVFVLIGIMLIFAASGVEFKAGSNKLRKRHNNYQWE